MIGVRRLITEILISLECQIQISLSFALIQLNINTTKKTSHTASDTEDFQIGERCDVRHNFRI